MALTLVEQSLMFHCREKGMVKAWMPSRKLALFYLHLTFIYTIKTISKLIPGAISSRARQRNALPGKITKLMERDLDQYFGSCKE